MLLEKLRRANPGLELRDCADPSFLPYGYVLDGNWSAMAAALERYAPIPEEGVSYVASEPRLEADEAAAGLLAGAYGGLAAQIGYCSGRNSRMNGMEYHRASELLVAGDDLVLILGLRADIRFDAGRPSYDGRKAKAFLICRGQAVELYSGTLHLAPCRAREGGFRAAIVLPRGTNENFSEGDRPEGDRHGGDSLLFKQNKWMLAHPERTILTRQGVPAAIAGPNLEIVPVGADE